MFDGPTLYRFCNFKAYSIDYSIDILTVTITTKVNVCLPRTLYGKPPSNRHSYRYLESRRVGADSRVCSCCPRCGYQALIPFRASRPWGRPFPLGVVCCYSNASITPCRSPPRCSSGSNPPHVAGCLWGKVKVRRVPIYL